jgi:hypothetical protein
LFSREINRSLHLPPRTALTLLAHTRDDKHHSQNIETELNLDTKMTWGVNVGGTVEHLNLGMSMKFATMPGVVK